MDTTTATPVGLLLSDDLIFISRIVGTARSLGLALRSARSAEALEAWAREQTPSCVIVDLANPGLVISELVTRLKAVCTPMPRVVAYGSHVDTEMLRAGRAAGCDPVLPRSKFVDDLERALPVWMAAGSD